jgi:hypothetical protein
MFLVLSSGIFDEVLEDKFCFLGFFGVLQGIGTGEGSFTMG